MQPRALALLCALILPLLACSAAGTEPGAPTPDPAALPAATVDPEAVLAPAGTADPPIPALATREAAWGALLAGGPAILPYGAPLDPELGQAQAIALADPAVLAVARDPGTGAALRAEVFQVRPLLAADRTEALDNCEACYRVEIYAYDANASRLVTVDRDQERVLGMEDRADTQPEVPPHLGALAAEIAAASPEVERALGFAPGSGEAGMPNVKTALNGSRCERSRHLCVAPTFVQGERALWAIVDLTEGRLVGTRWTALGNPPAPLSVSEQSLQDEVVMRRYCEEPRELARDGWSMRYQITPSDGLEILDLRFEGAPVLDSAKLVDWHVSYSGREGFGYSDATGCPQFSTASVVAFGGPVEEEIREGDELVGFALVQDFRSELWPAPCNYRYVQRFELYRDGRFRSGGANVGRGCGVPGVYRPVLRLALPAAGDAGGDPARVLEWDGAAWQPWSEEGWRDGDGESPMTPEGYQLRIEGIGSGAYQMAPNRGQLGDGSRGDDGYLYLTRRKPEEGDGDLLTIGPCCNEDHRQGPEKFAEPPEPLEGADSVLWVVPRLENSDAPGAEYCWADTEIRDGRTRARTFPCAFGPIFVPAGEAP